MALYACSDIHGQHKLFTRMLKDIGFGKNDKLYLLGDLIDRGPNSIDLLQDVMRRKNVMCLLGNHELMMFDHYRGNKEHDFWLNGSNGGCITKKNFDNISFFMKNKILNFIENMYLQIEVEIGGRKILLSHASFVSEAGSMKWKDGDPNRVFDVVWNSPWRGWKYGNYDVYKHDGGRFHVIGHVPVQSIKPCEWEGKKIPKMPNAYVNKENHLINIDLGCARMDHPDYTGSVALCCMNLTQFFEGDKTKAFTYYKNTVEIIK